jgi:TetR/AcrR family transcriptional regulator, repressor for neighboring sulfatase
VNPKLRRSPRFPRDAAAAKPRTRVRRSPEDARALILEACEALVEARGPEHVGLKDVAAKAGVSHALVTHYFGTIDELIGLALRRHAERQRANLIDRIASHPEDGPRAWMMFFFEWLSRPATSRLFAWAFVTGRIESDEFFSGRSRGARRVADAIDARLSREGHAPISKADLEFILLLLLAAPHGYGIGRDSFWRSLGYEGATPARDKAFFERLADLVEHHLAPQVSSPPGRRKRARAPR